MSNQSKSLESISRQKLEAIRAFIKNFRKEHNREPMMEELAPFLQITMEKSFIKEEDQKEFSDAEIEAMEQKGNEFISHLCTKHNIPQNQIRLAIDPGGMYDSKIIAGNPVIILTPLKPGSTRFNEVIRDLFRVGKIKKYIHSVALVSTSKILDWNYEHRKLLLQSRDIKDNEEWERIFGKSRLIPLSRLVVKKETKITLLDEETGMEYTKTIPSSWRLAETELHSTTINEMRLVLSDMVSRNANNINSTNPEGESDPQPES